MNKITTVDLLIECFDGAEPFEQIGILKSIAIPKSHFEEYATWKKGGYTRNCIARRDGFEFILLCWDSGAATPIHGHGGEDCWIYQIEGSIKEKRYVEVETGCDITNESVLEEGGISYMHDRMGYHTIENNSEQVAMTLHVYANPIDYCKVYNEEAGFFELKKMKYDTINRKVLKKMSI
jgi:cysteine dioxygenase